MLFISGSNPLAIVTLTRASGEWKELQGVLIQIGSDEMLLAIGQTDILIRMSISKKVHERVQSYFDMPLLISYSVMRRYKSCNLPIFTFLKYNAFTQLR